MGTTAIDSDDQQYACKCLNIRFRPSATHTVAADLKAEPDFTQLYVGDEGISIAHPQVTVRTRTRGVPIAGTSRCSRFTTITCLVCDLLVYRVHQTYTADVEGKDGPILPTEDWVERDILKSSSGWIEIHKQCLTREAISQALLSPHYCATFRLLLPSPTATPLTNAEPTFEEPSPPHSPVAPSPSFPKLHFGHLRPVFLPPPFTPSHPVFAYFSSIASNHSEAVRAAAEQHTNDLIQKQVSEIERGDAELRLHVDALWRKFRESLSHLQEQNQPTPQKLSTSRSADTNAARAIRDFVPDPVSTATSPSLSVPRISALSASLATSSFHHPRARADQASHRSSSPASNPSNGSTSSSTLILQPAQTSEGNSTNVLKFKRNINETINTAVSYRYFMNLEEEMARHREHRPEKETKQETTDQNQGGSSSAHDSSNEEQKKQPSGSRSDAEPNLQTNIQVEEAPVSRGRDKSKGKRKVTFDVEPAVVTIKREVTAEKEDENDVDKRNPREMIFELEDLDQETNESLVDSKSSLPLLEQPAQPLRSRKHRQSTELSGSFSTLRPASLPAPSHMRPPKSTHGADASSSTILLTIPRPSPSLKDTRSPGSGTPSPTKPGDRHGSVNPRDVEILKLVAANTPSHRGAWKPNSKAWQTFVRRQDSRDHTEDGYIAEEGEEEADGNGTAPVSAPIRLPSSSRLNGNGSNGSDVTFVGSLPIPMKLAKRPRQALSLASYQPQTAIPDRPVAETAPITKSTAALRKAVYAERDRSRSIDPGGLDFEEEEENDPLSDEEDDVNQDEMLDAGDRGRNRALKILQAGSEVPEAGMWRSLTT